jgi:steroid delta-isomerase-like uncharacterized protein
MTATQTPTQIDELAQRYGDAWNTQDLDAIMELHTDDCIFSAFAAGAPLAKGKEAVREAFAGYIAMLPDIHFAERSLQLGDDHWVLESIMSGTVEQTIEVEGESFGTSGARVEVPCVDVIKVRNGLIASKHTYIDSLTMQRQLGGAQ